MGVNRSQLSASKRDEKLHDRLVAALGVARIRWRGFPERALVVAGLSAGAQGVEGIIAEAEALESAWALVIV